MIKKYTFIIMALLYFIPAQSQIVGGDIVQAEEYPWVVSLATSDGSQGCGASLIAPQWVLTAGHCVIDFPGAPQNTQVIINSLTTDLNNLEDYTELIGIEAVFVHENFDLFSGGPDITLIRLAEPSLTTPIQLAEFSDSTLYSHEMPAKVLGWGRTVAGGSNSPDLLIGNCSFVGNDECSDLYQSSQFGDPFNISPDGIICAGFFQGQNPVGAAQGDSGGPLFFDDNGTYKQIGVVSSGNSDITTVDFPGLFTKVVHYRDWIDNIIDSYEMPTSNQEVVSENISIKYLSNNQLRIENLDTQSEYNVQLFNVAGQKLQSNLLNKGNSESSIRINQVVTGVYFCTIQNLDTGFTTKKKIFVH